MFKKCQNFIKNKPEFALKIKPELSRPIDFENPIRKNKTHFDPNSFWFFQKS